MAENKKNIIPIKLGDFSVLDSEFNSIRERFDSEMRKMEDEMTRFRSELLNREQSSLFSRTSTTSTSTSNRYYPVSFKIDNTFTLILYNTPSV